MTAPDGRPSMSYEVELPGLLGPVFLASLTSAGARGATVASVFRVPGPPNRDLPDVAGMLESRGFTVLGIRCVTEPDEHAPDERHHG